MRKGLHAQLEVAAVAVDTRDQKLVAQDPLDVDLRSVNRDVVLTAGDARPDEGPVVSEHLHRAETDLGVSGGLENQVGLADLGREAGQ